MLDSALACSRCSPRDPARRPSGSEPGPAPSSPPPGPAASWPSPSRLWLLDGLLSLGGWALPDAIGVPARVVLSLFAVWLAWRGFRWVSDRLLWRIRTKLIVSYLFIALVPVVLLTLFMAVAIVLLLGLTASRVVTGEIDRAGGRAAGDRAVGARGPARRRTPTRRGRSRRGSPPPARSTPGSRARSCGAGRVAASSGDAPRALPPWWKGPGFAGLVRLHPEEKLSAGGAARGLGGGRRGARPRRARRRGLLRRPRAADGDPRPPAQRDGGRAADAAGPRAGLGRGTGIAYEEGGQRVTRDGPVRLHVRGAAREDELGRPARRARSTGCRSRSSTSPGPSCGGCRPSSCRATRAGGACPTSCSTRWGSSASCSSVDVRGGPRPRPRSSPGRSRGASTRSRWGRRSCGRATSTTRSGSARATSSASWPSRST